MKPTDTIHKKIAQGTSDLAKAQQEVSALLQQLNAGTLNKQTLETGLQNLQQLVSQVSDHIPTFSN